MKSWKIAQKCFTRIFFVQKPLKQLTVFTAISKRSCYTLQFHLLLTNLIVTSHRQRIHLENKYMSQFNLNCFLDAGSFGGKRKRYLLTPTPYFSSELQFGISLLPVILSKDQNANHVKHFINTICEKDIHESFIIIVMGQLSPTSSWLGSVYQSITEDTRM